MLMKKIILILLVLMLAGCKAVPEIRPDTIVDIPLEPTQAETVLEETTEATEPTEVEETTEPETQAPTEAPTQKTASSSGSSGKTTSTKKPSSSSSSSSKKDTSTKATQPPKQTQPTTEPTTAAPTTEPTTEPPTEAPTRPSVSSYSPTALDYAVADAVNAQRAEVGLPALSVQSSLCTAAAQRACELSVNWSHTRPDGSWFTTVLDEFGCGSTAAAENLYYTSGSGNAETIVTKWMGSDAHRESILSENTVSIGVASYYADGVTYVAALFIG